MSPAQCPWYVAGPLLGLIVAAQLWLIQKPLGASGGYIDLVAFLRRPAAGLKWTVFFVLGMVLAGWTYACLTHAGPDPGLYAAFDARYHVTPPGRLLLLFGAATVMGYGIRTGGGCTSGHGICGTSLGSGASWTATAVFMGTAMVATQLQALAGIR